MQLLASVELVQKYTHVLLRRGLARVDVLAETGDVRALCAIRSFDAVVLWAASGLIGRYPALGMRDAVHAATARDAGLSAIVRTDRVFDDLAEFRRLDPIALVDEIARE